MLTTEEVDAIYQTARDFSERVERGMPVKPARRARLMLQLHEALRRRNPDSAVSLALVGGWLAGVVLCALAVVAPVVIRRLGG